jgi:hypothetical protein
VRLGPFSRRMRMRRAAVVRLRPTCIKPSGAHRQPPSCVSRITVSAVSPCALWYVTAATPISGSCLRTKDFAMELSTAALLQAACSAVQRRQVGSRRPLLKRAR